MSLPSNRRREPGGVDTGGIAVLVGVGAVAAVAGAVWLAVRVAYSWADWEWPDLGFFEIVLGVASGRVPWPPAATGLLIGLLTAVAVLAALAWLLLSRGSRKSTRVDRTAGVLGRGKEVSTVSRRTVEQTAKRLGVAQSPGVMIGRTVADGQMLYGSWEDMHVDIWGPRTGKTTSRAVPAVLDAPGAVLATSNKRDLVDASRDPRAQNGPVWVFDPQGIALEPATWWWNPLSYVTDEVKAAKLAEHFASGSRDAGARTDAYFDPAGQDLLAGLLLAGALDRRPITDVYRWLTRPTDDTAVDILRNHGYTLSADQVSGVIDAPDKQRGGVYGTAQQMASCLTNRQVLEWVTPRGPADPRPQFNPQEMLRLNGTLYSLSKEGRGTAGPLVTALTVAVVEAAEEKAVQSPGGRLGTPLVAVLDEAANVCRWRALPDLMSHYGSRGIIIMTILQSWSQGVDVWGESGMRKLWSAANIKVYGGGVSEAGFLEDLSRLIGDYDRIAASTSTGRGQRTVSRQLTRDRILDVAELQALPKGRAIVLASGSRPTLVRPQPWMAGPHAAAVKASIAAHDPAAPPAPAPYTSEVTP